MYFFALPYDAQEKTLEDEISLLHRDPMVYVSNIIGYNLSFALSKTSPSHFIRLGTKARKYFEMIEPCDIIFLVQDKLVVAMGQVVFKKESESLTRALWADSTSSGNIVIAVGRINYTYLPRDLAKEILNKKDVYLGDDFSKSILQKYGTYENFLKIATQNEEAEFFTKVELEPTLDDEKTDEKMSIEEIRDAAKNRLLPQPNFIPVTERVQGKDIQSPERSEKEAYIEELNRIAKLFGNTSASDLESLDRVTINKNLDEIVEDFSKEMPRRSRKLSKLELISLGGM